jgi:hypothetical protein
MLTSSATVSECRVKDEYLDVLVNKCLAENRRKLLFEVLVLNARQLDDDRAVRLEAV